MIVFLVGCGDKHVTVPEGYFGFKTSNTEFVLPESSLWCAYPSENVNEVLFGNGNLKIARLSLQPYNSAADVSPVSKHVGMHAGDEEIKNSFKEYIKSNGFDNSEIEPDDIQIDSDRNTIIVKSHWSVDSLIQKFNLGVKKAHYQISNLPAPYNIEVFGKDSKYMLIQFANEDDYKSFILTKGEIPDELTVTGIGEKDLQGYFEQGNKKLKDLERNDQKAAYDASRMENLEDLIKQEDIYSSGFVFLPPDPDYPNHYPATVKPEVIVNNTDKYIETVDIAYAAWDSKGKYINLAPSKHYRGDPEIIATGYPMSPNSKFYPENILEIFYRGEDPYTFKSIVVRARFKDGGVWENPNYELWRENYLRKNLN